jgi:hypothetical protein
MRFMPYSLALADFQSDDDVDLLFSKLSQVEPPRELIKRIILNIQHLPLSSADPLSTQCAGQKVSVGEGSKSLTIHNEKQKPC